MVFELKGSYPAVSEYENVISARSDPTFSICGHGEIFCRVASHGGLGFHIIPGRSDVYGLQFNLGMLRVTRPTVQLKHFLISDTSI